MITWLRDWDRRYYRAGIRRESGRLVLYRAWGLLDGKMEEHTEVCASRGQAIARLAETFRDNRAQGYRLVELNSLDCTTSEPPPTLQNQPRWPDTGAACSG